MLEGDWENWTTWVGGLEVLENRDRGNGGRTGRTGRIKRSRAEGIWGASTRESGLELEERNWGRGMGRTGGPGESRVGNWIRTGLGVLSEEGLGELGLGELENHKWEGPGKDGEDWEEHPSGSQWALTENQDWSYWGMCVERHWESWVLCGEGFGVPQRSFPCLGSVWGGLGRGGGSPGAWGHCSEPLTLLGSLGVSDPPPVLGVTLGLWEVLRCWGSSWGCWCLN